MMRRIGLASLLFIATCCCMGAEDISSLRSRVQQADDATQIDAPAMKPWHLKVDFQLYDEKGKPKEQGTLEEWWGPGKSKKIFTSPSYSATIVATDDGFFKTTGAKYVPYLLDLIDREIVHPLPQSKYLATAKPSMHSRNIANSQLDCITFSYTVQGNTPISTQAPFPAYCFDHGQSSLRVSTVSGGMIIVRNRIGKFQQQFVPTTIAVTEGDKVSISATITSLQQVQLDDATFVASPDLEKIELNQIKLPSGLMRGLSSPGPEYPLQSKASHIAGTVVLLCSIGTDGHVHSPRVSTTPNDDLAKAAMKAVNQWIYSPYTINSVPIEIETEITIHFSLGN